MDLMTRTYKTQLQFHPASLENGQTSKKKNVNFKKGLFLFLRFVLNNNHILPLHKSCQIQLNIHMTSCKNERKRLK